MQFELEAGAPRMVGRVLGWLLACDPPEQSAAELAHSLQASKGSISTATRVLLRMGLIERTRIMGERFDRFSALPDAWEKYLWREDQFDAPRRVLQVGLAALADEPPARRARLEALDWIYAWWQQRLPALHEEYLAARAQNKSTVKRGRGGTRARARITGASK